MLRSVQRTRWILAVVAAASTLGCGSSRMSLRQRVGETKLTSAPAPRALEQGSRYVPPSIELYVAGQAPGPCGMQQIPPFEFDYGSSTLDPALDLELSRLARCLVQRPFDAAQLLLVGHADPTGSRASNLDLAYARAEAIRSRLVELGVPAERIVTTSAGESRLPPTRWSEARRVDIVIARPGAAAAPPSSSDR